MTRRRVSNLLALAVLACLFERPMHPYEISTTLRSRGKEQSIKLNYGSLYAVVESLQKHALITSQATLREGKRPERTVYAITEAGLAEFEDWLAELLSTPTQEFTSLEAGLSLMAGLPADEVARLLEDRCTRLEVELRTLTVSHEVAREQKLPEVFLIESLFRETMVRAELGFVRKLAKDIRTSVLPGTKVWRRIHELRDSGLDMEQIMADPVTLLGEEARALASLPQEP